MENYDLDFCNSIHFFIHQNPDETTNLNELWEYVNE